MPGRELIERVFSKGRSFLPEASHAGLVFERYLRIWSMTPRGKPVIGEYGKELQEFVSQFNERRRNNGCPAARLLLSVHDRMKKLASAEATYRVNWRMTSGLGADHPTDSGFCFDTLVGAPIVSGTAIKGLCRTVAELNRISDDVMRTVLGVGPDGDGGLEDSSQAGELLFLDAYPAQWPTLKVDVVNCHHPKYYDSPLPKEEPPRGGINGLRHIRSEPVEWENPVPVYILTVDRGTEFVFRLRSRSQRKGAEKGGRVDVALDLLDKGLTLLGIGAKTAAGYGAMDRR